MPNPLCKYVFAIFVCVFSLNTSSIAEQSGQSGWWASAQEGYCYRRGNNWSECAGPHKLYPARSKAEILKRDPMCLYEPLCWTQFDWMNTPLPPWSCGGTTNSGTDDVRWQPLEFLDLSYHDGTMSDHSTLIEHLLSKVSPVQHRVTHHNCKKAQSASRNYNVTFRVLDAPLDALECYCGTPGSETVARTVFEESRHIMTHFDALIFTFGPSMFEHWMTFNKTMIISPAHRINMGRQDRESSMRTFEHARMLAESSNPRHIIGPQTMYDVEYLRHYTGLHAIYLPGTLFGAIDETLSWTGARPEVLINGYPSYVRVTHDAPPSLEQLPEFRREFDKHEVEYSFVHQDDIACAPPAPPGAQCTGRALLEAMAEHQAVVVWPYSVTNYRLIEQYAMSIPILAPSPDLVIRLGTYRDFRVTDQCPRNAHFHPDKELPPHPRSPYEEGPDSSDPAARRLWLGLSEVYHWPCVAVFTSLAGLRELLDSADLPAMSHCMRRAKAWRLREALQNWCWAAARIERGRAVPESYEAALEGLGVVGGRLMVHD